jgi:hypothetical protein
LIYSSSVYSSFEELGLVGDLGLIEEIIGVRWYTGSAVSFNTQVVANWELEESIFTPVCSPGASSNPVIMTYLVGSIPNN